MRTFFLLTIFGALSAFAASSVSSADVAQFTADPISIHADRHFVDFKITRAELDKILDTYHEISADVWMHRYSHVLGGDRTGTITLKDGRMIKWMVRPAGLATLTLPNGVTHYLARELPNI
jgi:hypothetical protein